ncbi:uncharacterized protein [Montipora foliosa]|uniref:uncharacterized protein n=1 Tax=Montipora foliosa TaxID=591990 RepID=UPI0035F149B7
MDGRKCIEVFGHIIFSFTRSVSEQYSQKDPEYSQETLEYSLLQNTGREWYAQPVDEIIYQEYSDKDVTMDDFLPSSCRVKAVSLDACSLGDIADQNKDHEADLDGAMSWTLLRPSALRTMWESTVIGASISLLSAIAFAGIIISSFIYPAYNKEDEKGKLIIALFSPLVGVAFKTTSRICVQRLWKITHPAYSYVMMTPLYSATAVVFRVLQVDLGSLKAIAYLGIIHGAAEVIERSTVVVIDHLCQRILKRASTPWGSNRTPRTERITADIAIMSMLYESSAIVSINGFFHLYQLIYMKNISFWLLMISFTKFTVVPLVIEWLFTSMSLAIETRYQNLAVMAVWRKDWRRHFLVALLNLLPLAAWASPHLFSVVQARFEAPLHKVPCKMPFS